MSIRVKLHGHIRTAAGSDGIELPDTVKTVGDLIEGLKLKLGADIGSYLFNEAKREMNPTLVLLVNGHSVKMLQGLSTPLAEGDIITIDNLEIIELVGGG